MLTPEQVDAQRALFDPVARSLDLPIDRIHDDGHGSGGVAGCYCNPMTRAAWGAWLARAEIAVGEVDAIYLSLRKTLARMSAYSDQLGWRSAIEVVLHAIRDAETGESCAR